MLHIFALLCMVNNITMWIQNKLMGYICTNQVHQIRILVIYQSSVSLSLMDTPMFMRRAADMAVQFCQTILLVRSNDIS